MAEFVKFSKQELKDLDNLIERLQGEAQFVGKLVATFVKVTKAVLFVAQITNLTIKVTRFVGKTSRTGALQGPEAGLLRGELTVKNLIALRKKMIEESRKK